MEDNFKLEIIGPEKIIFSDSVKMVKVPSYEGDMSILKNHISIITFLRPGVIRIEKSDGNFEEYFAQDGTIEFYDGNLIVLSAFVENIKNLSKEFLEKLAKDTQEKLSKEGITDHDFYILNHKLDIIKEIKI